MLEQRLAVKLHHIAHLWREYIVSALAGGLPNQPYALLEAWLRQESGAHLHHGGGEAEVSGHDFAFSPARSESSLPSRSSAYSSSQPPIWVSPIKICGNVAPTPARFHIS